MVNMYAERMLPPEAMTRYYERHYRADISAFSTAYLRLVAAHDPVSYRTISAEEKGSEYCREVLSQLAVGNVMCGIVRSLDNGREPIGQLSLYRGAGDVPFEKDGAEALRVKRLFGQVEAQRDELKRWSVKVETRVAEKVAEVGELSRLKRFFSAAIASKIMRGGSDDPLVGNRRDVAVVFVDLRGFTEFSDSSAPEDVMHVLREFHAAVAACIDAAGGTIERFTGDGVMVFFNAPEPLENPCRVALEFARAARDAAGLLAKRWALEGFSLNVGLGVTYGYATVGAIGYEGRIDYGAIGSVTNLAAQLCAESGAGEVLVQQRVIALAGDGFAVASATLYALKGFREAVSSALVM